MDGPQPAARAGGVVATLAFAGITAAIMQTLVTPLIAELPKMLHTTSSNAAWVITATLLAARRLRAGHRPPRRPVRQAPHAARVLGAADRGLRGVRALLLRASR